MRVAIQFNERLVNTIQDIELTTITSEGHFLGTLSESVQQEEQAIAELIDG